MESEVIDKLYSKIKILNETVWENRAVKPKIEKWLNNFSEDEEKLHALYLISKFMYFGSSQMRHLLKSLYRDLFKYPIIEDIRKSAGDTLDATFIEEKFKIIERKTKFLGVGNPSESGAHLLYFFRQENRLSKKLFIYTDDVVKRGSTIDEIHYPDTDYYVFIDDFCGSGSQVKNDTIVNRAITEIKKLKPDAKIFYLMLFATSNGIENVIDTKLFDRVEAVIELDNSFRCFDDLSRYFKDCDKIFDKNIAKEMAYKYGRPLMRSITKNEGCSGYLLDLESHKHALGFNDCQLLMGFHHNTPDNSLPIIWYEEDEIPWEPMFRRYNKKYGF
jgi:hypothetical protein